MARPGSWCWMLSRWGAISLAQKSSVVLAIARCSAVKSSGVNTSSGVVVSNRKPPPRCLVGERVDVAIGSSLILKIFEDGRRALAAADAHGHHAISAISALQLTQNRGGEFCASAA